MLDINFFLKMMPEKLKGIVSVIQKSAQKESATIIILKKTVKFLL